MAGIEQRQYDPVERITDSIQQGFVDGSAVVKEATKPMYELAMDGLYILARRFQRDHKWFAPIFSLFSTLHVESIRDNRQRMERIGLIKPTY